MSTNGATLSKKKLAMYSNLSYDEQAAIRDADPDESDDEDEDAEAEAGTGAAAGLLTNNDTFQESLGNLEIKPGTFYDFP